VDLKKKINEANTFYKKGEYDKALAIYLYLKDVSKFNSFNLNIEFCQKQIELLCQKSRKEFDPTTQLLLHNSGSIKLTDAEYADHLQACKQIASKKSEDADIKEVNPIPKEWPKDLELKPLPEGPNDYKWWFDYKNIDVALDPLSDEIGLSIIIPTFNRSNILDITLACLCNQATKYKFEVIVADDGSKEQIVDVVRSYESKLDIKYVRQKDYGYQLCAVRNLGIRTAKYSYVAILDCDMAPLVDWVDSYVTELLMDDDCALIGPRKYVDTLKYKGSQFLKDSKFLTNLPEVLSSNKTSATQVQEVTKDWRLDHFEKTDGLRLCDSPFRYFSGGNVAFSKKWIDRVGWFDEEFTHWGGEDNEFGYRLFKAGCFFKYVPGGMAYHQEPPGKENETDRDAGKKITIEIVKDKVPYFYRKLEPIEVAKIKKIPLVSIYVPAYNCKSSIQKCIDSALNQTINDLEVCICDDGSTDGTSELLHKLYSDHPRVSFVKQKNRGIGAASNGAVKLCNGFYIGQLDSDDYLEPDAVELCLKEFLRDRSLVCVYTTNRNIKPTGELISNGYNWPLYSREKFATAMIIHHFRMFSSRAWYLSGGFDEGITNAVDYDIYLKLSELGNFKHINKISYNRVLHGENTSIKKLGIQKKNHFKVLNNFLNRQSIGIFAEAIDVDDNSRSFVFKRYT
jgi:chondroitin synthase